MYKRQTLHRPLLGVCVGVQLLFAHSEEDDTPCLGLLPGRVRKLATLPGIRVPHMGWNTLRSLRPSSLTQGLTADAYAYFVHSYAAPITGDCVASSENGSAFAAIAQRGHVAGAQFHPCLLYTSRCV